MASNLIATASKQTLKFKLFAQKTLLGAKGIATRSKNATSNKKLLVPCFFFSLCVSLLIYWGL